MKFLANLLVIASLALGQFRTLPSAQAAAEKSTPTPSQTATATLPGETEPGTATPIASEAPLPVTETPTPISSETATPAPTGTEVPVVETVPPVGPVIVLNLSATPEFITPGGQVNIEWAIEGILPSEHELSLRITLPKGVTPTDQDVKFDEASLTLSIPVLEESGRFGAQTDQLTEEIVLLASLLEKEASLAETSLVLASKDQFTLTAQGGEIQTEDGKIKLSFPENTFREEALVQIGEPSGKDAPEYSLSGHPFSIQAQDKNSGEALHQFETEIEIEVNYTDLNIPEKQEGDLYLYWYNPEKNIWEAVFTIQDPENNTLRALTDHFSTFDIDVNNWQATHVPTVDSFQVSEFTGAGTYSMPIEVPPGPGGLQPNLTLNYNSQVVDQSTTQAQASWVGMGWSLEAGSIERDTHGTGSFVLDDSFLLNVAGVSTRLMPDNSGNYHPIDENFWKITFVNNIWTVWDKQGNIYYFETVSNGGYGYPCSDNGSEEGGIAILPYQWSLTRVKNIFGKEINYTYTKDTESVRYAVYSELYGHCTGNQSKTTDAAIYPSIISYDGGRYQVRFELENRTDYPDEYVNESANSQHNFMQRRLNNIYVEADTNADGVFESLIRRYDLVYSADTNLVYPGYTYTAGGKMTTLAQVTQYGTNNVNSLPATTFTYSDGLHLTHAENGYGGSVDYTYQLWYYETDGPRSFTTTYEFGGYGEPCQFGDDLGPWGAGSQSSVACEQGGGALEVVGTAVHVSYLSVVTRPGGVYKLSATYGAPANGTVKLGVYSGYANVLSANIGSNTPAFVTLPAHSNSAAPVIQTAGSTSATSIGAFGYQLVPSIYRVSVKKISSGLGREAYSFSYSYDGPAVNDDENSETCAHSAPYEDTCNAFIETYTEFRGHASVTVLGPDNRQTITTFSQDDVEKGQVNSVVVKILNGNKLQETINTRAVLPLEMFVSDIPIDFLGFGHYWVHPVSTENRTYASDGISYSATKTEYSHESTYGNLTQQTERSWNGAAWETNPYRYTLTDYVQNSTSRYLVGLPSRTRVFDGSGNNLGATTLYLYDENTGDYSTALSGNNIGKLTAVRTRARGTGGTDYSQVSYTYDDWGNRTSETTYSEYGTWNANPTSGARTTYTCFGGGGTLGGATCADDGYHTYPLWSKNPLNQTTSLTYNYIKGLPLSETDPNGAVTSATYDAFGRILSLTRPLDASPNLTFSYTNSFPFTTSITQHVDTSSYYTITRKYDGLGRAYETNAGGILTSYGYDAYGRVLAQTTPYTGSETGYKTVTTYDVLGRPLTVVAPDGTQNSFSYDGLTTIATDAKGYATTTVSDVWGRTVSVTPPTGPGVTYAYDPLDRMLTSTRDGLITTLSYDYAGRKVGMIDPDMGNWGYDYDALGNLTRQRDARICVVNMSYDLLNRMTNKSSSGTCGLSLNAMYTYDVGVNGIGRRTSASSGTIANSWTYDARGRVLTETVQDGSTSYTTGYTYNLADMPISMTYPGGEMVNYTYDAHNRLNSLYSALATYVSSSAYDSASRLTSRSLGNGLTQKYIYPTWNSQGGRLDKIVTGLGTWNSSTNSFDTNRQKLDYAYDAAGNITQTYDTLSAETQSYGYDTLHRLTSWTLSGQPAESYSYDSASGNLSAKAGVDYTYSTSHPHAVESLSNGNTYSYDANGNMITHEIAGDANLVVNPGFESTGNWSEIRSGSYPGTSLLRSTWGTADQRSGEYAYAISNQAHGYLESDYITVLPNTQYDLYAWVRGELDAEDSAGNWIIRAQYYDSSNNPISFSDAASGAAETITSTWTQKGGRITTPTNAAKARIQLFNYMSSGWLTFDDVSAIQVGAGVNLVVNPSFESAGNWSEIRFTVNFPGTSFVRGTGGPSSPHGGSYGYTISNLAYGWLQSDAIAVTAGAEYDIYAWVRGELDAEGCEACNWIVRVQFLNNLGDSSYVNAATGGPGTLTTAWAQKGGRVTAPSNASTMRIQLFNELGSGWVAFDDVSAAKVLKVGTGVNLVVNPGFESAGNWSENRSTAYPGTSFFRSTWGTADQRSGAYAYALSNHAYGYLQSEYITVLPNTQYDVYAWVRGELDADDSAEQWIVRAEYYDSSNNIISHTDAAAGGAGTLTTSWAQKGGRITTPSNAAKVRVQLYNYMNSGWAAFDDVSLKQVNANTQSYNFSYDAENRLVQVQKNGATIAQFTYDADGKRVKSVMGTETILFVGAHYEVKNGSEITKYYLAGSTRIAMRKYTIPQNMTVEYLLGDHLGSTSLTTDTSGAKVLELRYKPWGEIRYSWNAPQTTTPAYKSPLYTYTGQASYMDDPTTVGVTEGFGWMFYNARWYDPALGRFAQADTMIPDGIQGLDHYAYVNNNPVNGTDPTGHHCDEDINGKCILPTGSPTDKLFVDSSSSIPPSTAVTPYNGDTCNNCGVEPEINLSNPQSAGYKATAAGVVIQVASDVGNSIQDFHAQNDKDIPVYVNVATNTDGSVTVPSIEVDNKTSIEVSVIAVKFRVEGGNGCKYVFTACLSAGPYSYNVSPGPGIYEPQSTPGLGIIQPHTNQQISISPSGYGNNPTNTFRTGFTVRITLGYTAGGRTFLPISFSFP